MSGFKAVAAGRKAQRAPSAYLMVNRKMIEQPDDNSERIQKIFTIGLKTSMISVEWITRQIQLASGWDS
jgi:hypothetical protein